MGFKSVRFSLKTLENAVNRGNKIVPGIKEILSWKSVNLTRLAIFFGIMLTRIRSGLLITPKKESPRIAPEALWIGICDNIHINKSALLKRN
jgi:hypothetical protein